MMSELYRAILMYDLESINEHPEIYSSYEVVKSMGILDKVVARLTVELADDEEEKFPDYADIVRREIDIQCVIDAFDWEYTKGCLAYIDCLLEDLNERAQCAETTPLLS